MADIDKLINERMQSEARVGLNVRQLYAEMSTLSPEAEVLVINKNGRQYSITYADVLDSEMRGQVLALYVD